MNFYKKTSALVVSGGAAFGIAHVGALRELDKKYEFDSLYGVSAGAIVAAAVACKKSADEISKIIHSQNFIKLALDFSPQSFGIVRGKKILKLFKEVFAGKTFEDLPKEKKLHIFATDFETGKQVVIKSGCIAEAVRASISIPAIFDPVFFQEKWLVDGGLSQNFPLDYAIQNYSGKKIIGIDVGTCFQKEADFSQKKFWGKAKRIHKMTEQMIKIMCSVPHSDGQDF